MNSSQRFHNRHARRVGLAFGIASVAAMAAFGLSHGGSVATSSVVAGSGDAPSNTTYTQPAVGAMTQGATATFSAPPSTPSVESAVPSVKAGG